MEPKALLRQKDAAEYLGVSIRYLRDRKDIRPVTLPSGHGERPLIRYRVSDLDAWVERHNATKKVA